MSDTKFTKGPWTAGPPATGIDPKRHRYIHAGGELVGRADAGYIHFDDDGAKSWRIDEGQLKANAQLMACAPELYAELKACIQNLTMAMLVMDAEARAVCMECITAHKAVLAKAEATQ